MVYGKIGIKNLFHCSVQVTMIMHGKVNYIACYGQLDGSDEGVGRAPHHPLQVAVHRQNRVIALTLDLQVRVRIIDDRPVEALDITGAVRCRYAVPFFIQDHEHTPGELLLGL